MAKIQLGKTEINLVRIGIAVTTLITAVIHILLGEPLFILNGLGYIFLGALAFLPLAALTKWQGALRWLFGGYTLLTIILFFVFHPDGTWQNDELGVVTKFFEVLLLLLLVYDAQGKPEAMRDP